MIIVCNCRYWLLSVAGGQHIHGLRYRLFLEIGYQYQRLYNRSNVSYYVDRMHSDFQLGLCIRSVPMRSLLEASTITGHSITVEMLAILATLFMACLFSSRLETRRLKR